VSYPLNIVRAIKEKNDDLQELQKEAGFLKQLYWD
jgi:hypothetical protein